MLIGVKVPATSDFYPQALLPTDKDPTETETKKNNTTPSVIKISKNTDKNGVSGSPSSKAICQLLVLLFSRPVYL